MSHWDFGRPPADHDSSQPRYGPGEAACGSGSQGWEDAAGDAGDLDDEVSGQYPITYERGRVEPDASRQAAPPPQAYGPWPAAPAPGGQFGDGQFGDNPFQRGAPSPGRGATGELPRIWPGDAFDRGQPDEEQWLRAPAARPSEDPARIWPDVRGHDGSRDGDAGRRGRRWVSFAGAAAVAVVIGGTAVLLTRGHPGSPAAGSATRPVAPAQAGQPVRQAAAPAASPAAPPLSVAQARGVLAGYTTVNNGANARRSDTALASIETGSSYAIDSGLYLMQRAAGGAPYPAFAPAAATYYIPRTEPAAGPRWFAVRVGNAFSSSPQKVSSVEYLLFTQATPGGPWQNAIEPYLLSGASVPQPAIGADGLATAVAATAASLAAAPGQLPALTAASLSGTGSVAVPGNLAETADQRFWQRKLPTAVIAGTRAAASGAGGATFALRTAGGGALVFYTDAASLVITAPAGTRLRLTVPGLYSSAQSLTRAGLSYLDQFAAYDPPAGAGTLRVIADYSGITGRA